MGYKKSIETHTNKNCPRYVGQFLLSREGSHAFYQPIYCFFFPNIIFRGATNSIIHSFFSSTLFWRSIVASLNFEKSKLSYD